MSFFHSHIPLPLAGAIAAFIGMGVQPSLAIAPVNDNFENSTVLPSATSLQVHGTTLNATVQAGESGVRDTVWYSWTAPSSGLVALSAVSEGNPLHGAIIIGDNLLTAREIAGGVMTNSAVPFYAVAGITYKVQVSDYVPGYVSYDGYGFNLGLAIIDSLPVKTRYVPPAVNDNFDNPYVIIRNKLTFVQYMAGSSLEPFEGDLLHSVGLAGIANNAGSTWIAYTPNISGVAQFSASTPDRQNVLLIEGKGASIANFKPKKVAYNGITFNCKAGKTYRLYILATQTTQVLATVKVVVN